MIRPIRHLFGFSYSAQKTDKAEVSSVSEDSPFEKAGIKQGDIITAVNGEKVSNGAELAQTIDKYNKDGNEISFEIERNGSTKNYQIRPKASESKTLGFVASTYKNGSNALVVLKYSLIEVKYWIETTIASLGQLVTGQLSVKQLSGPVGIVDTVGNVMEQSVDYGMKAVVMNMLYMAVLLSANLGVMNLLPLPALDGGRLVFILIEAVRGKPIDRDKEGYVHFAGFVILMLFMVFVMYNDIIKILH